MRGLDLRGKGISTCLVTGLGGEEAGCRMGSDDILNAGYQKRVTGLSRTRFRSSYLEHRQSGHDDNMDVEEEHADPSLAMVNVQ